MPPSKPGRLRRPAAMYAVILIAAGLVTIIGLSALAAVRIQRRMAEDAGDLAQARNYAQSAIDLGLFRIDQTPAWRTTYANGAWFTDVALMDGRISLEGIDPVDGNLADDAWEPLQLIGTGRRGRARYRMQVMLAPVPAPLDLLRTVLHCEGELKLSSGKTLTASGGPVSTNGLLLCDGTLIGNAEAASRSGGGTVVGTSTVPAPNKAAPPSDFFDRYWALATPLGTGDQNIDEALISPAANPGGALNAAGVYRVSANSDISIKDTRLNGTLVIDATGKKVKIHEQVLMQPARADYPVLVIKCNKLEVHAANGSLIEDDESTNYNPQGTPHAGVWDNDKTDSYPCEIQGFVYVKGDVEFDTSGSVLRGTTYATGKVEIKSSMTLTHLPTLYSSPPLHMTQAGKMRVNPGSRQQISD